MNNIYDDYNNQSENNELKNNIEQYDKVKLDSNSEKKDNSKKNMFISIILIMLIILFIVGYFVFFNPKDKKNNLKKQNNESNVVENNVESKKINHNIQVIDTNSKTRPYAVMINCHNSALPQAGLNNAYIVYELMVEGGITRMMALFKDKEFSKVGSIRSARTQYLDYVHENDAIYVHAGGARDALHQISREALNDIDVDGVYGVRDRTLNRAWEHTLFTNTSLLNQAMNDKKYSKTTNVSNLFDYSADSINTDNFLTKQIANSVNIKYSNYRTANYVYNADLGKYLRSMNGNPNIDLLSGEQYSVKNIIVYGVKYSNYTYNGNSSYQKIDNLGSGDGYYITNGYAIPITWEKSSKNSQTIYKYKETGDKLILNDGNTYIQIYPISGNLAIN